MTEQLFLNSVFELSEFVINFKKKLRLNVLAYKSLRFNVNRMSVNVKLYKTQRLKKKNNYLINNQDFDKFEL